MKITLRQAALAMGVMNELGEQVLDGAVSKAIHTNKIVLRDHADFLIHEETKLIRAYGAVQTENGLNVPDNPEKNDEFCQKMRSVQQMTVEVNPAHIDEDTLVRTAKFRSVDLDHIDFITHEEKYANNGEKESEKK